MKKENKNNKKIISIIVALVFVVTIVFVLARPNLLRRTTGNVSGADETLVVGTADYTEMCKYYNEALKLNLSDYSNTSDLEDALLNLDWDLTEEDQAKVDSETKALKDSIASLKKKGSDTVKKDSDKDSSAIVTTTTTKKANKKIVKPSNNTTTTTTEKQMLNKVVTKTDTDSAKSSFKWWIIPIDALVLGLVGFVVYKAKKEK